MKTYLLLFLIFSLLLRFSSGEDVHAVVKPNLREHSAPTVYAAASSDFAAPPNPIVRYLVAKANALPLLLLPHPLLLVPPLLVPLLLVPAGIFRTSFQEISSIQCLITWTIMLVLLEGSSLTTPSSPPLSFSLVSGTPETLPQGRRRSQPSSARLPTKPPVIINYYFGKKKNFGSIFKHKFWI